MALTPEELLPRFSLSGLRMIWNAKTLEVQAESFCCATNKFCFAAAFGPCPVVDVCHDKFPIVTRRDGVQRVKHGHGIHPAGNGRNACGSARQSGLQVLQVENGITVHREKIYRAGGTLMLGAGALCYRSFALRMRSSA